MVPADSIQLSWPANGVNFHVESAATTDWPPPWTPVNTSPQLSQDQWLLTLPIDPSNRFFRLAL